jgi:hypothetical protein
MTPWPEGAYGAALEDRATAYGTDVAVEDRSTGYGIRVAEATPTKKKKAFARTSDEGRAAALVDVVRPLFKKEFSRRGPPLPNEIGRRISVKVVPDSGWASELTKEAERQAADLVPRYCKFAPEMVVSRLQQFYNARGEELPKRLTTIDENTKLNAAETRWVVGAAQGFIIKRAKSNAANVLGIYSRSQKVIIVPKSALVLGTLTHELAHAYAHEGWVDFMRLVDALGKYDSSNKLNEGMAVKIASTVLDEWLNSQPTGTAKPSLGYDPGYETRADSFLSEVGDEQGYEAYFGGWVDYTNDADPLGSLKIGNKNPTTWKWHW